MINFKNVEFQLYGYLVQLQEMFRANRIGDYEIERINENIQLIQSRKFTVAVMGEFKRGKSSLINAMLGLKLLPADVTPATATINRITYGSEPSMTIFYKDGTREAADMKNISNYVTMLTEEGSKRAAQINEAVICYPTVICQNHVDIIDTPGLNDNIEMTRITMTMLKNIDAAIVVVSALAPFSEKETEFVCELIKSDNIENIVFVVTYIDQIDEDERDKLIGYIKNRVCKYVLELLSEESQPEEVLQKAKRLLDNSLIFGVSSLAALKSFVTGDRNLLKESRFEEFKTNLYKFLTSQQGINTIIKAIKGIRNAGSEFDRLCNSKISMLEKDIDTIEQNSVMLNNYFAEYKNKFDEIFKEADNSIKEVLNKILALNESFIKNFREAINKCRNMGKYEIIAIFSSSASICRTLANEKIPEDEGKEISKILFNAVEKYYKVRNSEFIGPFTELKKICGFDLALSELLDKSIAERISEFPIPEFKWLVSPVPNAEYFHNYSLTDNSKYAVNTSVQKFYGDWNEYINLIKKWWLEQVENEVVLSEELNNIIKENKKRKQNELYLLRNTYSQQRNAVESIKEKTEAIYNEIFLKNDAI